MENGALGIHAPTTYCWRLFRPNYLSQDRSYGDRHALTVCKFGQFMRFLGITSGSNVTRSSSGENIARTAPTAASSSP